MIKNEFSFFSRENSKFWDGNTQAYERNTPRLNKSVVKYYVHYVGFTMNIEHFRFDNESKGERARSELVKKEILKWMAGKTDPT